MLARQRAAAAEFEDRRTRRSRSASRSVPSDTMASATANSGSSLVSVPLYSPTQNEVIGTRTAARQLVQEAPERLRVAA